MEEQGLFGAHDEALPVVPNDASASGGSPRLRKPERFQGEMIAESLDQRIDADHPVRLVWDFVQSLDLSQLLKQIKAVEGRQGRDANDPRLLLSLWLYAAIEGVGSARRLAELCVDHRAYQWLCGKEIGRASCRERV